MDFISEIAQMAKIMQGTKTMDGLLEWLALWGVEHGNRCSIRHQVGDMCLLLLTVCIFTCNRPGVRVGIVD